MADKKISALTAATTPLAGTEVLPIVQSGSTVKVANNDLRPKQIQSNSTSGVLQITGPAAAATRVMTTPDANFTVARTDAAQTFTGNQTFGGESPYVYIQDTVNPASDVGLYLGAPAAATYAGLLTNFASDQLLIRHNGATRITISSGGNATLNTGNLVQGTAAKGINFTANTPAAGMTSQLLNWYEEGDWTPTVTSQTGAITTYTSLGKYNRIGRTVTIFCDIYLTTVGTAGGVLNISGLPYGFYGSASLYQPAAITRESNNTGTVYGVFGNAFTDTLTIRTFTNGAPAWANGNDFSFVLTYLVD